MSEKTDTLIASLAGACIGMHPDEIVNARHDLRERIAALEREAFEDNILLGLQNDLLASIAAAVRGAPPKGMCWGYHDLPELIAALKSENAGGEAVPVGYKLLKDTTHDERAWLEDAPLENGNYYNSCGECLRQFTGYKRRVVCKSCAAIAAALQPKEQNNG